MTLTFHEVNVDVRPLLTVKKPTLKQVECELCGRRQFDVETIGDGSLVIIWIQCWYRECKHKNRIVFEG